MEKREKQGYIMQLQNFSVNDGDGIRTTIFLCGCPLNCIWCCNPEHKAYSDREHLITVEEVLRKVSRMSPFFRFGGGGITFSGGEATLQQGFLRELAEAFYDRGYSLSIETCGVFPFDEVKDILEKMDLIFFDLKVMDPALHHLFTGMDNTVILENLKKTASLNRPMVVRIPVITGVNAWEENIRAACSYIREAAPKASLEFLPYHRFGTDKYTALNLPGPDERYETVKASMTGISLPEGYHPSPRMEIPDETFLSHCRMIAESFGIQTVSYK